MPSEPPKNSNIKKEVAYELHKPARRNYKRRHVGLRGFRDLFQADLVEMIPLADENRGYKYLLTCICCFSKYAWARPIRNKKSSEVAAAMKSILESREKRFLKPPKFLQTDRGREFRSRVFHQMLDHFGVKHYFTHSNLKASICERFNRTLKNLMYREFSARGSFNWVGMLDELMERYNNSHHRTINMAPAKVRPKDEKKLRAIHNANHNSVKRGKIKFHVGDIVRISSIKGVFDKGYYANWSTELFKIVKVCNTNPVTYKLEDHYGRPLLGGFYNEEISKTRHPDTYLVEKILKRRGNKVYVKFLGFDDDENMWIPIKNMV